jgi:DNA invertase Pin-like site-specific DNA recombinase
VAKDKRGPVAFGYARVSTQGQAEFGKSLEMQREKVKAYYDKNLADVALWGDIFVDSEKTKGKNNGVSGKTLLANRPAGSALVARLRPGDHVIINDISRAWRSFKDAVACMEAWIDKKIVLHIVREGVNTQTVYGQTFVRLMAIFAQVHREMISEQTKEVMRNRKAAGKLICGVPGYGERYEGIKGHRRLVADERELDAMDTIVRMHEVENMDFDQIYFAFIKANVRTREDKPWSRSRVWRAYRRHKMPRCPAPSSPENSPSPAKDTDSKSA